MPFKRRQLKGFLLTKNFSGLIIRVCCFCLTMTFCSTGGAQESNAPVAKAKFPLVSFGFDIAMLQEKDLKDVHTVIDFWMKMMGEKTGYRTESYIYKDLDSLLQDYKKGILDVLNFEPPNYLRLEKKLFNLQPAFTALAGGKKTRKYLLIVPSDSAFTGIQDLRGRKLAILKNTETDHIYLSTLLLRKKLGRAENFFSKIIEKTKYSQAVLSVFFGQADACISHDVDLKTMIELNPQIGSRLKIIASSPEIINLVAFVRSDYNKKLKERGLREILNLQNSTDGRQGLVLFGVERFVPLFDSDLDSMRELFNEYNRLLKENKIHDL